MSLFFDIDTRNFQRAASEYAARKNKSDAEVVNKAMRYWLPFAAARVKAKTPGGAKIRRELTGLPSRISRGRQKRQGNLANTLAAALVAARIRKRNSNAVLPRRQDADRIDQERIADFYDQVTRFVNARVRSANYLRAGFIPAFLQFKVPNRVIPGQDKRRGYSVGKLATASMLGHVEAFARNARHGAAKIAPNAFRAALPDVTRQFLKWLEADTVEQGRRSGFY